MSGWGTASLRSVVTIVDTWNPTASGDVDSTFTYIDLGSVDQAVKEIVAVRTLRRLEAPSRARQIVQAGDILVSTVRPNLNGVAVVPKDLDGATASTGFCVLRPDRQKLSSSYLFHWVRSSRFVNEMTRLSTGASYPAVSDRVVLDSKLPLPPLAEQHRIADILDRADALRAKRLAALAHLDTLSQSIFLEMFGDPVTNPKRWPTKQLGDPVVGTLERGVSKHRPRNAPELLGGPYPLVQTGEVANSDGYIREYSSTYSEIGLKQSKMWPAGTLCITIAANIAKTGVLTFDACFPDSVVGFRSTETATVEFVRIWLSFLQATLEDAAPESAQKNINLALLRNLDVPFPPMPLQRDFATRITAVEALKGKHRESLAELDALFASLQHRAFSSNRGGAENAALRGDALRSTHSADPFANLR